MKKTKFFIISNLLLITFLFLSTSAFAVKWIKWEWSEYGLSFELPDGYTNDINNTDLFSAYSGGDRITISPNKDYSQTPESIAKLVLDNSNWNDKQILSEYDSGEHNGFNTYALIGNAVDPSQDKQFGFIMIGFINPESDVNFVVTFTSWDLEKMLEEKSAELERFIQSLKKQ